MITLTEEQFLDIIKNKNYLKNITNPSQKLINLSIRENPKNIEFLQSRTEEDFFKAALLTPKVIRFLQPNEKRTFSNLDKIYRRAILGDPTVIKYIDEALFSYEKNTELKFLAIEMGPMFDHYDIIKYIKNPTPQMCYLAINIDPYNINYIKNPTEKMIFTALKLDGEVIKSLKEPYKTKYMYRTVKDKEYVIFDYTVQHESYGDIKVFDYRKKHNDLIAFR